MLIKTFTLNTKQKSLLIDFYTQNNTLTTHILSFEYLRISSPDSIGKKTKSGQPQIISHKKEVILSNIESVAKHGYRFIYDDGHSAIYSEEYIQLLAKEYEVRWQHYLADIKANGYSREAMIDFKQL